MKPMTTSILALTITGWAFTLTAAAQEPEEHALRAELDGVEPRMAAIPARGRDLARERLIEAVTAIQSDLPASPAELEAVFPAPYCYYPSSHRVETSICLFEGTPFEAMRRFVRVVDGKIRARGGLRIGRDSMTEFFRERGLGIFYRNHSNAKLRNSVGGGIVFGSMAKRKDTDWTPKRMRNSILHVLYHELKWLPQLDALPRIADMRSTRRGNSSQRSPVTVAGVYVAHLVNAARSHAAATCAATVRNGARLAKAFSSRTPEGEAADIYVDATRLIRGEIEQIAASGADELCDRRQTDMRALVDPVLERVVNSLDGVEIQLYERARLKEKLNLDEFAGLVRKHYFFGPDVPIGRDATR